MVKYFTHYVLLIFTIRMYVIDSGGQQTIVNAMRTLEGLTATSNGTCVQFRERDAANDASFINIHNGSGCSSYVSVH